MAEVTENDPAIPDLSRTHLHVLQILWDSSEALKPAEIEARFRWPIENATLRSVLRVLMERGDVEREKSGKAFVYRPKQKKGRALADLLGGLAEVFSSGSRAGLIAQLLEERELSAEEVEELKRIAIDAENKNQARTEDRS